MDRPSLKEKLIVVSLAMTVGLLHFVTGPGYRGPCPAFVNGYLIDILLPFAMYLLLGIARPALASGALSRGLLVFAVGATAETLQYFGVPLFGRTFDVLDYGMFALGIGLAAIFELAVLRQATPETTP
ncbi:MAG: hypothetical protein JXA74_17805 [Anaerolineae bacterium]|nr:hypothetical protein [Anaerolineae bacterium]